MQTGRLVIGTRGSKLALVQTSLVIKALQAKHPKLKISPKVIVTKGDRNLAPIPLDTVGKAWFTKEIEDALLAGTIDLAIHSLKDMPPQIPDGLLLTPILKRDDARDVLVSKNNLHLDDLPRGAVIGTDSIRRKAQLLRLRPDLEVRSIRGNVDTRLQKLANEDYDGVVIAAAGLARLGLISRVSQFFGFDEFVPAAGQAILAAEARQADNQVWDLLKGIQDPETVMASQSEQAFNEVIGGGCKLPVGCYVRFNGGQAEVYGMLGSLDAQSSLIARQTGPPAQAVKLAEQLAKQLLHDAANQNW